MWVALAVAVGCSGSASAAERVYARGNVPVISGGVGEDSVARLKAREQEFNLKLVLTLLEGNYLADVGVTISDAAGKALVEHVTDGPIFMARLPPGAYIVTARYNGIAQTKKVSVRGDRLHTEYLRWPGNPQVDYPGPIEGRGSDSTQRPGSTVPAAAPLAGAPSGGVAFISGGIGEGAQARLLAREKEFNLKLVFTLVEGNYVAGVGIEIRDSSGKPVISHVADGPFFLARLPAGVYSVTTTYDAQTQAHKIIVAPGRLRTDYIRWKSNPQADTVLPPER